MSGELVAQFEKRYPRGAVIAANLRQPAAGISISVLFGPSGCGKTTVLRCLAGLERPESGHIQFGDEIWLDAAEKISRSPQRRDVGFLFQDYALFPHRTVAANIGYGLSRLSREDRQQNVDAMLDRFQLSGLAGRYPHQISGGQQQRVALARVLVRRPRLLLLDEPLSALDSTLRDELRRQLRQLLRELGIPVILVTHDRMEALALADSVVVMESGAVLQQGSIDEVFARPANLHVARIVGIETVAAGEIVHVAEGLATVQVGSLKLTAVAPAEPGRQVHVCIKGEDVTLQLRPHDDQSVRNQFSATVTSLAPEGPLVRVVLSGGSSGSFPLSALVTRPACEDLALHAGQTLTACVKAPSIHLIPR